MNYFQNITTANQLKAAYRRLCKQYHPDKGGSTEQMQALNNEYEALMARFLSGKSDDQYGEGKFYRTRQEEAEVEAKVREAVEKIAHLDGLDIEIIGAWVWVSGDTKPHKDALKEAGYWWMHKRQMWAFKGKASQGRGQTSMEEMREKYGSEKVHSRSRTLTA
ncbi:DnaJ-class molecular chaperone [Deinococcus phoenicis]|uniref:DnaJ-class molecular chaperone n=1 Tax=Deinococcus phoenicis TaxID=1476583 RepID=A0A016QM41_9DEIO|nr:DnaJ domain-containing protein [Deinococcus phoenicis]EYB66952.1 DnaJ-class molecular chaperone [Deinococcus phoenicis]